MTLIPKLNTIPLDESADKITSQQVASLLKCLVTSTGKVMFKISDQTPLIRGETHGCGHIQITFAEAPIGGGKYTAGFTVIGGKILNIYAMVTPKGRQWTIDQENSGNLCPPVILGQDLWKKVEAIFEYKEPKRIGVVPCFRAAIFNGDGSFSVIDRWMDKGTSPDGLKFPLALTSAVSPVFYDESECNKAAEAFDKYQQDMAKAEPQKHKIKKKK